MKAAEYNLAIVPTNEPELNSELSTAENSQWLHICIIIKQFISEEEIIFLLF